MTLQKPFGMMTKLNERLECRVCGLKFVESAELSYHYLKHSVLELAQALTNLQVELLSRCFDSVLSQDFKLDEDLVQVSHAEDEADKGEEHVFAEPLEIATELDSKFKASPRQHYECEVCNKKLGSRNSLEKHMLQHSGERPHKCELCDAAFTQRRGLRCHVMQKHSMERPFKCSVCNKGFVYNFYLEEHMTYHTGDKKHQCSECGKRFPSHGALTKHIRRHSTVKNFKCHICSKMFKVNVDLKTHLKFVHRNDKQSKSKKSQDVSSSKEVTKTRINMNEPSEVGVTSHVGKISSMVVSEQELPSVETEHEANSDKAAELDRKTNEIQVDSDDTTNDVQVVNDHDHR